VALVIFTSAIYVALARSRLAAVVALGAVGYGIALIFIFYGAPDLAMTQFLFETLSVLLFVLVLVHLPRLTHHSSRAVRLRDGAISVLIGLFVAGLVLATTAHRFHPTISDYFAENSYTEAHGRNVVNVILVDFRGLDTLGEITVLAVSALGVFALLRLRQSKEAKK
jgi:multicomponent Na+:H+ antiporter subunit A